MHAIEPGARVIARRADDQTVERRAMTGIVQGEDFAVVWICAESEWEAAQADGREPQGVPWPAEDVTLATEAVGL